MALSTTQTGIVQLIVGMFGAAPGKKYLDEFTSAAQDTGQSLNQLAQNLELTSAFQATYPTDLSNADFAEKFVTNILGDIVTGEPLEWAILWAETQLDNGASRTALIQVAAQSLLDVADDHPDFGTAKKVLANKIQAAANYSESESSEDIDTLIAAISGVTEDISTIPEAKDPPVTAASIIAAGIDALDVKTVIGSIDELKEADEFLSDSYQRIVTSDDGLGAIIAVGAFKEFIDLSSGTVQVKGDVEVEGIYADTIDVVELLLIDNDSDFGITLTDKEALASDLIALDKLITGTLKSDSVQTVTGSLEDITAIDNSLSDSYDKVLTLGGPLALGLGAIIAVGAFKEFDDLSSGTLTVSEDISLQGSAAEIIEALEIIDVDNGLNAIITDEAIAAADVTTLDQAIAGSVDASAVKTVTGSLEEITAIDGDLSDSYNKVLAPAGPLALGLGAIIAVGAFKEFDDLSSGTLEVHESMSLQGTLSEIIEAISLIDVDGGVSAIINDDEILVADLITLDSLMTGSLTIDSIQTATGSIENITLVSQYLGDSYNKVLTSDDGLGAIIAVGAFTEFSTLSSGLLVAGEDISLLGSATEVSDAVSLIDVDSGVNAIITDDSISVEDLTVLETLIKGTINTESGTLSITELKTDSDIVVTDAIDTVFINESVNSLTISSIATGDKLDLSAVVGDIKLTEEKDTLDMLGEYSFDNNVLSYVNADSEVVMVDLAGVSSLTVENSVFIMEV